MMKLMSKPIRIPFLLSLLCLLSVLLTGPRAVAQIKIGDDLSDIDYRSPRDYEIAAITVEGTKFVDPSVLSMLSGLRTGDVIKVPGDDIAGAIRKIWEQGMFDDVAAVFTAFSMRRLV